MAGESTVASPWLCSYLREAAPLHGVCLPVLTAIALVLRAEAPLTRTKWTRAILWSEPMNSQIVSQELSAQDHNSIRYQSVCNTGGPLAFSWASITCPTDAYNCVITQTFSKGRAEVHKAPLQVVLPFGWDAIRSPPETCKNAHRAPKSYCMPATQLRCLKQNILYVVIQRR